jgi:hypothetical protein
VLKAAHGLLLGQPRDYDPRAHREEHVVQPHKLVEPPRNRTVLQ